MTKLISCSMIVLLLSLIPAVRADDDVNIATAQPVVVNAVPESGSDRVDPATTEIKVTYSKDMQDGSWSWSTAGEHNFPKIIGKPHYLKDKRTCVLPVALEPDKTYAIWLNSENFGNFKDTDERSAVPYLLVFKTGGAAKPSEKT